MSGHRTWSQVKKDRAESAEWERLQKVVARMRVFDLLEHTDGVLNRLGKAVSDYRKNPDLDLLLEFRLVLTELEAVVEELILRDEAANDAN